MVLVVSTSSPLLSIAAFEESKCIDFVEELAPRSAGGTLFEILQKFMLKNSLKMSDFKGFIADIGPGSFTGIKVGITVVKSAGYIHKKPVQGILSFDLLPFAHTQVISIRKKKYFIKRQNEIFSSETFPENGIGYCSLKEESENVYPSAKNYTNQLQWINPEKLNPLYMEDPNISVPKVPYGNF